MLLEEIRTLVFILAFPTFSHCQQYVAEYDTAGQYIVIKTGINYQEIDTLFILTNSNIFSFVLKSDTLTVLSSMFYNNSASYSIRKFLVSDNLAIIDSVTINEIDYRLYYFNEIRINKESLEFSYKHEDNIKEKVVTDFLNKELKEILSEYELFVSQFTDEIKHVKVLKRH